ncbi:hypothetical protein KAH94_05500 [bacterium]|nr:hypothetical protein [bacterium]
MNKKVFALSALCFLGLMQAQQSKAFVGLAVRVGMFYTVYKFVDGIAHGAMSKFVNKYIDGPIDFTYSFGKGVQTFGIGFRAVCVVFFDDKDDGAFGHAWDSIKNKFDYAVFIAKEEWNIRREAARIKKALRLSETTKKEDSFEIKEDAFPALETTIEPQMIVEPQVE